MMARISLGKRNKMWCELPVVLGETNLEDTLAMALEAALKLGMVSSRSQLRRLCDQGAFQLELKP